LDIQLTPASREWQAKARQYADDFLLPYEVEAELNGGRLPDDIAKRNKSRAVALGFSSMDVPTSYGGLGLAIETQVAVWEQLGRITNALSWCFAEPQSWMFEACNQEQLDKYVLPLMNGKKHDCYAITEEGPGSDISALAATATRDGGDYLLNGEKWFVTSANLADYFWFQARIPAENDEALFFIDQGTPGAEVTANPLFSHTYAAHHPTYRYRDVRVPAANRVGQAGDGMAFTKSWFRRERLMIAARCCGAAARLIEEARQFAAERMLGGEPLSERQAIQMMLADSATELWSARLMTFESAAAHDRGEDLRSLHVRCSIA
jgi:alkylation response protein AidB-like acyl-CoA dehydrogenase